MLIVTSLFVLEICTVITVRFLMIARNNHICYNMCVELHMYSLSLVICAKIITYCKEYRQIPLTHGSQYRQILASFLLNRFCCVYVCIKICRLLILSIITLFCSSVNMNIVVFYYSSAFYCS